MKFLGPVRFHLNSREGLQYTGLSRLLLQKAKDRMGVDKAFWTRTLPDGTKIIVSSLGGVNQVWIDVVSTDVESFIVYDTGFYFLSGGVDISGEIVAKDLETKSVWQWLKETNAYDGRFPETIYSSLNWATTGSAVCGQGVGGEVISGGYRLSLSPNVSGYSPRSSFILNKRIYSIGVNTAESRLELYWKNYTPGMDYETGDLYDPDLYPNGWRTGGVASYPGGDTQSPSAYSDISTSKDGKGVILSTQTQTIDDIQIRRNGFGLAATPIVKDGHKSQLVYQNINYERHLDVTNGYQDVVTDVPKFTLDTDLESFYSFASKATPRYEEYYSTSYHGWNTGTGWPNEWQLDYYSETDLDYGSYLVLGQVKIPINNTTVNVYSHIRGTEELAVSPFTVDYQTITNTETRTWIGSSVTIYPRWGVVWVVRPDVASILNPPTPPSTVNVPIRATLYRGDGTIIWEGTFSTRPIQVNSWSLRSFPAETDTSEHDWGFYTDPVERAYLYFCTQNCPYEESGSGTMHNTFSSSYPGAGFSDSGLVLGGFARLSDDSMCITITDTYENEGLGILIKPDQGLETVLTSLPSETTAVAVHPI